MKYFYTFGLINPYLQNKYLSHYSYVIVQSKNPAVAEKGASIRVGKAGNGGTGGARGGWSVRSCWPRSGERRGGAGSSLPRAEMDGSTIWAPGGGEQIWGSRRCRQRRACRAVSHPEDALLHMFG